jgi:hypothetical protein
LLLAAPAIFSSERTLESSLSYTYDELCSEIATMLGYDPVRENRSTDDQQRIDWCIKSGQRQTYVPPNLPGEAAPHQWHFLTPVRTLTLEATNSTLALPDDFGSIMGNVYLGQGQQVGWELYPGNPGDAQLAFKRQPGATGRPNTLSVDPIRGTTMSSGQRFQFSLFPAADGEYTLTFQYKLLPEALSPTRPYGYGGMMLAETIRAACLMAAEEFLDNAMGLWAAKFRERLSAAVGADRQNKPQYGGRNMDRSDDRFYPRRHFTGTNSVTFDGVAY